jgi:hypothetical protein
MSVEARLQALIQNYRAQHGDAGLHNSPQLIAQLSSQAPDLYGEIRALAAAVTANAAARIAGSPDQDGEANRVATEIAGSEKLSMAVATAGVAVARALGPVGAQAAPPMPSAPAADVGGWAGDSVAVGAPPAQPAPGGYVPQQPYAQPQAGGYVPPGSVPPQGQASTPITKNPIAIIAVAAVAVIGGYYLYSQRNPSPRPVPVTKNEQQGPLAGGQQGPQSGPGAGQPGPGEQPGQQGPTSNFPTLVSSGDMPTLPINTAPNGLAVPFTLPTQGGPAAGAVILPTGGWDSGPATIIFGAAGDTTGQGQVVNQGSAQLQRVQGQTAGRLGQVQWQQDGLNMGPICVAFVGQAGANGDIGLAGTTMCITDSTCEGNAVCGRVGQMRR